jgi:dTDP-4-dehydrorhamnose reductase
MTRPTWMITGSNGFLGANAAAYLETRANVIGITRQQHDLTKPASLAQEIAETKPNYLLHTAAIADHTLCEERPDLAEAINAEATKVIARACEHAGTKLIYISTDAVSSGQPTATKPAGNYLETDPPNPNTVYGETKLQGELSAQRESNLLIIRTNFFGWSPTGQRSILEFFVHELRANRSVNGLTNVTTTSLYIQTLLDYIYQLKDHSGTFHVASRDAITKYEFGIKVAKHFDLSRSLVKRTEAGDPKDLSLNTTKLAESLGVEVQTQSEGLLLARSGQDCQRTTAGVHCD